MLRRHHFFYGRQIMLIRASVMSTAITFYKDILFEQTLQSQIKSFSSCFERNIIFICN